MKSQIQPTLEEKGLLSSVNLMTRVVSLNIGLSRFTFYVMSVEVSIRSEFFKS